MKSSLLVCLFSLLLSTASRGLAQVYSVSTVAGMAGFTGQADATGPSARFSGPVAVAVDGAGNLFVGETNNAALRKITPGGTVSTIAQLANGTAGLVLDGAGNVYLTDASSHVVRRVASDGTQSILAGQPGTPGSANGTGPGARFNNPGGIARDANGFLYVADTSNSAIRKISADGVVTTLAGLPGVQGNIDGPGPLARFYSPTGIAVDGAGNVYVADSGNHTIRKITPTGDVSTFAGSASSYYGAADGVGSAAGLPSVWGLAIDATGTLFATELNYHTIRKISPAGAVSTIAGQNNASGSADGVGNSARFLSPRGIAVDAAGNFYVADTGNQTIRKGLLIALPAIGTQPAGITKAAGQAASFSVTATGPGALSYQWQRQAVGTVGFVALSNGGSYAGATTATLTVSAVTAAMNGDQFRCVVANEAGAVNSAIALVTVTAPPAITSANAATFYVGQAGSFTFVASGLPTPTFSLAAGTLPAWVTFNTSTGLLTGTPPSTAGSPFAFTVGASNSTGSATQAFTLSVQVAPVAPSVTTPSALRQLVANGQPVTLSAAATGTGPLTYQWKRNGLPIAGATAASYAIPAVSWRDGGYYYAVVSGPGGTGTSPTIFVTVSYTTSQIIAWGDSGTVPDNLTNAVAISAGNGHHLALKADGTVIGWGSNGDGQTTIPAGLGGVVAIAAGGAHSLALKSDGTVVAWGYNTSGQATVPTGLGGVVAIAAGSSHSLALKQDGTVVAWGSNSYGQTSVPAGLSGVSLIAASYQTSGALKPDGTFVSWGYSVGSAPAGLAGSVALAMGNNSTSVVAARADGTVAVWGDAYYVSGIPAGLSGVVAVGMSYYQAVALKSDGTIVVWGGNYNISFALPPNLRSVVAISSGNSQRLALRDASNDLAPTITTSPVNATANLGQSVTFSATVAAGTAAISYQWFKDGGAISGATAASYTVSEATAASAGNYYLVATNSLGSAASGTASLTLRSSPIVSATNSGRYPLVVGQSLTLSLSSAISSSATVEWRRNGVAIPGATGRSYTIASATLKQGGYYQAVYNEGAGPVLSGAIFVPVTPAATQVLAWGNSSTETTVPAGLSKVVALASRISTTIAVKADGTIVRWGNYYGNPVPEGLGNVVSVAVGYSHYLALRADGTVVAWGEYSYNSPAAVPDGLAKVVAIAAGSNHSLALKDDGTVVAWGNANYGATAVPAGLANVVAIAAGDGFSLALRADGTVVAWGYSNYGQASVPTGLSGVVAIAAGYRHSLALKGDGTVVAWGNNDSGQATPPTGLSDVVALGAGDSHSLAVRADGSVVGWGYNGYGQTSAPAYLRNTMLVTGGSNYSVALRDASGDTVPVISVHPAGATALVGQRFVLRVTASGGTAPVNYQWRKANVAIPGATGSTLTVPVASAAEAGSYDVVVSNYLGSAFSQPAILSVNPATAVTTAPTGRQVLAAGQSLTLNGATSLSGAVTYQWRRNGQPIPGATAATYVVSAATWASGGAYQLVATNAVGPAASAPLYLAVPAGARIRTWGDNGYGQTAVPASLTDPIAVAAGANHSLALKSDGTVIGWGGNNSGQCNVPAGLANVVAIAAGYHFSMALTASGTVVTWGGVNYTPPEVTSALAIASDPSSGIALALRADGTVVSWDVAAVRTEVPAGLSDVVAIASGNYHRLALKSDGTVVQWGSSSYYSNQTPVPPGLGSVIAIASGYDHLLALKSDGTVAEWSSNSSYNQSAVPTGLSGVVAIAAGSNGASFALKADGSVVTWGSSYSGNTLTTGAVGLAPAYALSVGGSHALGLRDPSQDAAPTITVQPVNQVTTTNQTITLTVAATGTPAPTYQWYRNGIAISGATGSTYSWYSYSPSDAGVYSVTVSNALGSVSSNEFTLVLNAASGQRGLLTSSARAEVGAGIVGTFTIEGTGSKQMLLRAVGPALAAYGATGLLADPQLSVASASGAVVATNDDWAAATNASQIAYLAPQFGAFALSSAGKDAAILRVFNPGTYNVRVTGPIGTAGVAMLEIYDADSASRLVSVSTHAFAGTGNKVFVQGFVVAGAPAGRSYLIRAIGPSLGGGTALTDPQLAIFDSAGVQVAANDNWGGDSALAALATAAGAMPLASGSKDAAVSFIPAGPGAYTVQISDAIGGSGQVLVEIFEVDAQRATSFAPAIVAPPVSAAVLVGRPATFGVVATGLATPTYQWRKNGVAIDGATTASLAIASAQPGDAGDYSVVVTNAGGSVISNAATLSLITQTASHAIIGPGYHAGATLTISNTLSYVGSVSALGWQVTLPAGWSYASGGGVEGDVKPLAGATGTLEWAWTTPPSSPVTFTYTVNVPMTELGLKTVTATALVQAGGSSLSSAVGPGPIVVGTAATLHSADSNTDGKISLSELLRVIELYNTRNGTSRTGRYAVQADAEDGFAGDPLTAGSVAVTLSAYHSADTSRDGKLSLTELLRMIELYNYRAGTTRTGQYHAQAGTEDGFAPGA